MYEDYSVIIIQHYSFTLTFVSLSYSKLGNNDKFYYKKSMSSYASHYQAVKLAQYTERHHWEHCIQLEVITTAYFSVAPLCDKSFSGAKDM